MYTLNKRYEFVQSNGNHTTRIIITNPEFEHGCLYADKIADFKKWVGNTPIYVRSHYLQFFASGSWNLTEYEGDIYDDEGR